MGVKKRHEDLSLKIFDMGQALIEEGDSDGDYVISKTGNFMLLISGLIFDEDDVTLFSELCGMFSAKKLIESQEAFGSLGNISEDELFKTIKRMRDELGSVNIDDTDEPDDDE